MRGVGVDNIVRLAKDDVLLHEDREGREGDLKEGLDAFANHASSEDKRRFETLELVLEHHLDNLKLLIDVRINRSHAVGEHPIEITVNGLASELGGELGEDDVRAKMGHVFQTQASYDDFVSRHRETFSKKII